MSKIFNLFLLHKKYDIHPRSWICVNGNSIREIITDLENEVKMKNNINREQIAKIISKKLGCSHSIIKRLLQSKKGYYPLPVILQLAELSKNKKCHLNRIHKRIEFLKVNSASSKPVKAVRNISIKLSKILGAFMADGSLSYQVVISSKEEKRLATVKELLGELKMSFSESYSRARKEYFISFSSNYNNFDRAERAIQLSCKEYQVQTHMQMEICDEHETSVKAFNKWMKNCFGIKPSFMRKRGNSWRAIFPNKILGRYLICYFGIKPGYKTDIAFEPLLIKSSSLSIRKAFALGVLTFDGSSTISGNVSFDTKSKNMYDSIGDILAKSGIEFGSTFSRGIFRITTYKSNNPQKLNSLFENGTVKWLRYEESYKTIKENDFQKRYKRFSQSKITFDELIKVLRLVGSCDIDFLTKQFKCRHTSICHYLNVLKNNSKVRLSPRPVIFKSDFVSDKVTVYLKDDFHNEIFDRIVENFAEFQKFAKFIDVHKATLSSWKLKKNRMPLSTIKRICGILKIDVSLIDKNVEETDRRIIEVI